jgi:exodeoxyribonuclease V alpha subunit
MANLKSPSIEPLFKDGYFSALDYYFAKALGRMAGETDPLVLLAAAIVSRETARGQICVDLRILAELPVTTLAGEAISELRWPGKVEWMKALDKSSLVAESTATAPLVRDPSGRLYMARYWDYQQRLVAQLRERALGRIETIKEDLLAEGLCRFFPPALPPLTMDLQRVAAEKSVRRYLTVISGGPGTGKTTTVVRILALIIEQALAAGNAPPRIRLAAPTGKAAARLNEAIAVAKNGDWLGRGPNAKSVLTLIPESAMTLHRLLGGGGQGVNRFRHDDRRQLPVDVLVVDESSMVDLALMTRLVEALPQKARLILLGDKDQLSSVEAGAILGDICQGVSSWLLPVSDSKAVKVPASGAGIGQCIVHLTHSYRFDGEGGIGSLSRAINSGDADRVLACLIDPASPSVSLFEADAPEEMMEHLSSLVQTHYVPYMNEKDPLLRLHRLNQFRILCAHRKGPSGVDAVNDTVAEILKQKTGMETGGEWFDGRPIMVTQNDYQLGLFNGDIGVIGPSPEDPASFSAFFPATGQGVRYFSPHRLSSHETVFAMTVHKGQGAEFDHILLVLPPRRSPIITRELLYTAVTRARKSVTIFGSAPVIREAVRTPVQRASGIGDQLWSESPPPG